MSSFELIQGVEAWEECLHNISIYSKITYLSHLNVNALVKLHKTLSEIIHQGLHSQFFVYPIRGRQRKSWNYECGQGTVFPHLCTLLRTESSGRLITDAFIMTPLWSTNRVMGWDEITAYLSSIRKTIPSTHHLYRHQYDQLITSTLSTPIPSIHHLYLHQFYSVLLLSFH